MHSFHQRKNTTTGDPRALDGVNFKAIFCETKISDVTLGCHKSWMVCGYTTTLPETNGSKSPLEFFLRKETKKSMPWSKFLVVTKPARI